MANYYATIRTNYFSVKDKAKYRALINDVSAEDTVHVFESPQPDGSVKFGFGCLGSIYGIPANPDDDDSENDMDCFIDALQNLVAEDDAVIILEAGYEKLRYVIGPCTVITSKEIRGLEMMNQALRLAQEMLQNTTYNTQMDY